MEYTRHNPVKTPPALPARRRVCARVALGASLLAALLWASDRTELLTVLSNTDPWLCATALVVGLVSQAAFAAQWAVTLRVKGIGVRYWRLLALDFVGYFWSNFVPSGVGGDVARTLGVVRDAGHTEVVVAALLLVRVVGFCFSLLVLLCSLPFDPALRQLPHLSAALAALAAVSLAVLALVLSSRPAAAPRPGWKRRLTEVRRELHSYRHNVAALCLLMAWTLAYQILIVSFVCCCARAVGCSLPFARFLVIVPLVTVVALVPLSPNGTGLREGSYLALLRLHGETAGHGLALGLLVFAAGVLVPSVIGAILWVRQR